MPSFRRSLPMMLNYTLDAILPAYREVIGQHGLTEQQWRILRVLSGQDTLNSAEISKRTLLPKPSLVGILDRLEAKGLIKRERSQTDRRNVIITTTPMGRDLAAQFLPQVEQIQENLRSLVTPAEWDALERTLTKITTAMKPSEEPKPLDD